MAIGVLSGFPKLRRTDMRFVVRPIRNEGTANGDNCCGLCALAACIVLVTVLKLLMFELTTAVACLRVPVLRVR